MLGHRSPGVCRGRWRSAFEFYFPIAGLLLSGLSWGGAPQAGSQSAGSAKPDPAGETAVLIGAGDIVGCKDPQGALATAKLIDRFPGTVFAVGDLVYDAVTLPQFQNCYGAAWGKFKERTNPALGNHENRDPSPPPYFQYLVEQPAPLRPHSSLLQ